MNDKSKMFIAVFAVLIMIGGALVPLTYPSTEATVEDADDDSSSFSLATIIEKIKEKGAELLEEIDLGNAKLVPTDAVVTGETTEFGPDISTDVKITDGNIGKFKSGITTTFKTGGHITIEKGGMLVLFPTGTDSIYTIANENCGEYTTSMITMNNGSIISILGMKFVVNVKWTQGNMDLFGMGKVNTSTAGTVSTTFSYKKVADSEKYTLAMKIGSNCKVGFIEKSAKSGGTTHTAWSLVLRENAYKTEVKDKDGKVITPADHPDVSFTGTISGEITREPSGTTEIPTKLSISLNIAGFLLVDARGTDALVQGHANIEKANASVTMVNVLDAEKKSIVRQDYIVSADVKTVVNTQIFQIIKDGDKEVKQIRGVIENGLIQTGDMKVTVSMGNGCVVFSASEAGNLIVSADMIMVDLATFFNDTDTDEIATAQLKIVDLKLSANDVKVSGMIMWTLDGESKTPITDLIVKVPSLSLTINSATMAVKYIRPIAFDKEVSLTIAKDVSLKLQDIDGKYFDETHMNIKVGEISIKASVGKDLFKYLTTVGVRVSFAYDASIDISIKNVNAVVNMDTDKMSGKANATLGSINITAKMTYEGMEKSLQLSLEDLSASADLDKLTANASIGKIYLKNNVPLKVVSDFFNKKTQRQIDAIAAVSGVGSADVELQINKLASSIDLYDVIEEHTIPEITADSLEFTLKNGTKYKEMHVKFSDNLSLSIDGISFYSMENTEGVDPYKFSGLKVKCGNVEGYCVAYTNEKNSFSVTDSPTVGVGIMKLSSDDAKYKRLSLIGAIKIYSGTAKFEGGKIPFAIDVAGAASFSANGLCAPIFIFEGGCNKTGTVVLDTNGFELPLFSESISKTGEAVKVYRMSMIIDSNYTITTPSSTLKSETLTTYKGGYKMTFDLSDITTGKIEANAGYLLPEKSWSNTSGLSITTSEDRLSGTFDIVKNADFETYLDVECSGKNYTFGYEGGSDRKEYAYGAEITLAVAPTGKDGFIGWTDGSGKLYKAESKYYMPARDVTMSAVYSTTKEATVSEGKISVSVDVPVVTVTNIPETDWTEMTVKTSTSTVTISRASYEAMNDGYSSMVFGCLKSTNIENEDLAKMVEGKNLFAMKIYFVDKDGDLHEADYSGQTEMKVTVFVSGDKTVDSFKVYYVNQNGYLEEVKADSWEKVEGGYNVTFTVTHFSMYAVEPVYKSNDNTMIIIAAVIIVLVLIGIGVWYYKSKQKA